MDPESFHLLAAVSNRISECDKRAGENDISKQFFMISENRNMFIIGANKW